MGQDQVLEQALRQSGLIEGILETFGAKRGLGRVFEDDGIASHQRRKDAVDRGQIGIIPRGDDEDDAQGLAADEPGETRLVLGFDIGQGLRRDLDHVAGTFLKAAHFERALGDRPTHLARDLLGTLIFLDQKDVDCLAENPGALGDWCIAPFALGLLRCRQYRLHFGSRVIRPLHIDGIIDRGDGLLNC